MLHANRAKVKKTDSLKHPERFFNHSLRCCDRLLCLNCDLAALSFDDVRWDGTADYLFLRNNYPDK